MTEKKTEEKKKPMHPFLKRNLIAWSIRWTIAFVLLYWFTGVFPFMKWLWFPAIMVAGFSLLLLLLISKTMRTQKGILGKVRKFVGKVISGKW